MVSRNDILRPKMSYQDPVVDFFSREHVVFKFRTYYKYESRIRFQSAVINHTRPASQDESLDAVAEGLNDACTAILATEYQLD